MERFIFFFIFIKRRNIFSTTFSWTTQPVFAFLFNFIISYCQSIISIGYFYSLKNINGSVEFWTCIIVVLLNKTVFYNTIGSFAVSYICSRQRLIVDNDICSRNAIEHRQYWECFVYINITGNNVKKSHILSVILLNTLVNLFAIDHPISVFNLLSELTKKYFSLSCRDFYRYTKYTLLSNFRVV